MKTEVSLFYNEALALEYRRKSALYIRCKKWVIFLVLLGCMAFHRQVGKAVKLLRGGLVALATITGDLGTAQTPVSN